MDRTEHFSLKEARWAREYASPTQSVDDRAPAYGCGVVTIRTRGLRTNAILKPKTLQIWSVRFTAINLTIRYLQKVSSLLTQSGLLDPERMFKYTDW